MSRRFCENDRVIVSSDNCADYGLLLGNTGTISALGMKTKGCFTYLVDFGSDRIVRVFEDDLTLATASLNKV